MGQQIPVIFKSLFNFKLCLFIVALNSCMYLLMIYIEHLSWVFIKVHRYLCWGSNNLLLMTGLLFKILPRASLKVLLIILNISIGMWALSSTTWKQEACVNCDNRINYRKTVGWQLFHFDVKNVTGCHFCYIVLYWYSVGCRM